MPAKLIRLFALIALLSATQGSVAQIVWNQLLTEGQLIPGASSLPGFQPQDTIRSNGFRDLRITPNGNFSVITNTDPSQGNTSFVGSYYVAGSDDRGQTVRALRREDTIAGVTQQTIGGAAVGIDHSGSLFYTSRHDSTGNPIGLWIDDTLLFVEGDAISSGPLSGSFFDSFGWAESSPTGVKSWISDYAATSGGSAIGEALFRGTDQFETLLKTGDALGSGLFAQDNAISGNLSWSALATNYLTKSMISSDFLTGEVVVLNGEVVPVVGGGILREGDAIPAAAGGQPTETWAIGSLVAVNEAGDWAVSASARINGVGNTTRDMIVMNGVIVYADGDVVDGHTLSGLPSHLSLNDQGDMAFAWDNKAFLNGEIIAEVGSQVDTTGDGVGDTTLTNVFDVDLTNLPSSEASGEPLVYVKARVVGGLEVVLRNDLSTLEGDYNGDGLVNAADYTVWRDTEDSTLLLGADGNQNNTVDEADRLFWQNNYGRTASVASASIPEPGSFLLGLTALIGIGTVRKNR